MKTTARALRALPLLCLLIVTACSAQDSGNQNKSQPDSSARTQATATDHAVTTDTADSTGDAANAQPASSPAQVASAQAPTTNSAADNNGGISPDMYVELPNPVPSEAPPGQVEVIEFFLYTCPHCNHFDPILTPWSKHVPGYVYFHRVPAAFGPNADMYARAHYAAIDLHVLDKFRPALFHALHEERRNIDTMAKLTDLFTKATGIDAKTFTDTFNSFGVDNQVRRGKALNQAYAITGVPSLGIAGKYVVTPSSAKGFDGMLKVTDVLTKREHEAMSAATGK